MRLYHASLEKISEPKADMGRKNADFGQGFYMTTDRDFAGRWGKERKDLEVVLNVYDLELDGLAVHRFEQDESWFNYIYSNRNGGEDTLEGVDVIIGPIANDTIYDTLGIITSGLLRPRDALKLLEIGPRYEQVAVKTDRGIGKLRWLSSEALAGEETAEYKRKLGKEETDYQELFAKALEEIEM